VTAILSTTAPGETDRFFHTDWVNFLKARGIR
jgi:hypothetical protein